MKKTSHPPGEGLMDLSNNSLAVDEPGRILVLVQSLEDKSQNEFISLMRAK